MGEAVLEDCIAVWLGGKKFWWRLLLLRMVRDGFRVRRYSYNDAS
ncbi:hypothetical protein [Paenibacillus dokdonensis]